MSRLAALYELRRKVDEQINEELRRAERIARLRGQLNPQDPEEPSNASADVIREWLISEGHNPPVSGALGGKWRTMYAEAGEPLGKGRRAANNRVRIQAAPTQEDGSVRRLQGSARGSHASPKEAGGGGMSAVGRGSLDALGAQTWDNCGTAEQSGTGRTPTSDPLLDRINLDREGSGPDGNNARG